MPNDEEDDPAPQPVRIDMTPSQYLVEAVKAAIGALALGIVVGGIILAWVLVFGRI